MEVTLFAKETSEACGLNMTKESHISFESIPPQWEEERHDLENVFGDYCRAPAAELFKFIYDVLVHRLIRTALIGSKDDGYILLAFGRKSQQLPSVELLLLCVPYHYLLQKR